MKDQLIETLKSFKDWSNYMLVTTVAALGWVTTQKEGFSPGSAQFFCTWSLALSIVFGVFTLGLIPRIMENIKDDSDSIFAVTTQFNILWFFWMSPPFKLKYVCWPQHVLFLVGVIIYASSNAK